MFECELPFDHKTLHLELEDKNFAGVMEGHQNEFKTTKSQEELVEESLANPYGARLRSRSFVLARRISSSLAPTIRVPFPRV